MGEDTVERQQSVNDQVAATPVADAPLAVPSGPTNVFHITAGDSASIMAGNTNSTQNVSFNNDNRQQLLNVADQADALLQAGLIPARQSLPVRQASEDLRAAVAEDKPQQGFVMRSLTGLRDALVASGTNIHVANATRSAEQALHAAQHWVF
jgi:hypothetical protein